MVHPQCALSGASPLHRTVSQQLPLDWLGTGPSYPGGTTIMVLFATSVVGERPRVRFSQYFSTSQGLIVGGPSPRKDRNGVRLSGQFFGIWSFKRGKSYLDAYHCVPATLFFSWRYWLVFIFGWCGGRCIVRVITCAWLVCLAGILVLRYFFHAGIGGRVVSQLFFWGLLWSIMITGSWIR